MCPTYLAIVVAPTPPWPRRRQTEPRSNHIAGAAPGPTSSKAPTINRRGIPGGQTWHNGATPWHTSSAWPLPYWRASRSHTASRWSPNQWTTAQGGASSSRHSCGKTGTAWDASYGNATVRGTRCTAEAVERPDTGGTSPPRPYRGSWWCARQPHNPPPGSRVRCWRQRAQSKVLWPPRRGDVPS